MTKIKGSLYVSKVAFHFALLAALRHDSMKDGSLRIIQSHKKLSRDYFVHVTLLPICSYL